MLMILMIFGVYILSYIPTLFASMVRNICLCLFNHSIPFTKF